MKRYCFLGLLGFVLAFSVQAAEPYEFQGFVGEQVRDLALNANLIIIGGKQYSVDIATTLEGDADNLQYAELGPIFKKGQFIGFNIDSISSNKITRISEIWILSPLDGLINEN